MEPLILQKKAEVFLNGIYPLLARFPKAEKFALCQEIKQSCYRGIRYIMLANVSKSNRRSHLQQVDAEWKLLLVLFGIAKGQRYITARKLLEIQSKIIELGKITGGLMRRY